MGDGRHARRRAPLARLTQVLGLATVLAAGMVVAPGALPLRPLHMAGTGAASPSTSDCNHNGVSDFNEAGWSNRDDDGDGVCNGFDNCPYEVNPAQSPTACQMQAITVPGKPEDPSAPHVTYSGATITLKGIARYGGTQYKWDFGDGLATSWMPINNPFNLGVKHTYGGSAGHTFTATLSVANGS